MRLVTAFGVVVMVLAIGCCVLLGTVGWFVVGFATMTDCTTSYSCSTGGCSPCAGAGRWITLGGIAQWVLAGLGIGLLVRGVRTARGLRLVITAVLVVAASALVAVGTGRRADGSYCRPGTAGYSASYCSIDARPARTNPFR